MTELSVMYPKDNEPLANFAHKITTVYSYPDILILNPLIKQVNGGWEVYLV